jgi:hypothetical protein
MVGEDNVGDDEADPALGGIGIGPEFDGVEFGGVGVGTG